MRRIFVYTISVHRNEETKRYIVTKDKFRDRLAIQLGDTDIVAGWLGVTSANYVNADKMIRQLKKPHNAGLICTGISFRIFDNEEFKRYNKDNEYALYVGDIMRL